MTTYVKTDKHGFIVNVTSGPSAPPPGAGFVALEDETSLPADLFHRDMKYQLVGNEVMATNIPSRPPSPDMTWDDVVGEWAFLPVDDIKTEALHRLKQAYLALCDGTDPATGKHIYIDCMIADTTYRMNAGRGAAETHDAGVRLAEQSGEETTLVVDFHNEVHYAVPIAVAKAVALQQAQDARGHYVRYQQIKQMIAGAQTVAEVRGVDISFDVNVEE